MVIFWPALFLAQGDGVQAAEVARLKGEMDAIETVSREKGCGIQFQREEPKKPRKDYDTSYYHMHAPGASY